MFLEGTPAEAVTQDAAERVVSATLDYLAESGMSRAALAKAMGISPTTLGLALSWKYAGAWREIVLDLDRWLEEQEKRDAAPRATGFVRTKVAEELRAVADAAATLGTIGLVFGPSGVGKTMALHAVAADKPGSVLVTAEKMNATATGLLHAIGRKLRVTDGSAQALYHRVKTALAGTPRLLIIDQIHNLCGGTSDRPLYVLSDLLDATGAPQLWCGTTDIVAYLDRGQARGQEPLSQIRRRIGVCRDLTERTGGGGGGGEPLFAIDEIRRVFANSQMRLASDASRYLAQLANMPDGGGLGTCRNLVVLASKIHQGRAESLTADMLRAVHRLLASRRVFDRLEQQMAAETAAPTARAVPA